MSQSAPTGQGLLQFPVENEEVKRLLDQTLKQQKEWSCETVANTIFPQSLWNPEYDRQHLFDRYMSIWPRIHNEPANRHGTYFQRLIAFRQGEKQVAVNQLEHIIQTYHDGNHRASALQAAIMDPTKDHTDNRQRGFPCMQHVIFTPHPATQALDITGIFANQHIFEKAYGNYLGLYRLGKFMAHELGFTLTRVICIASLARLGNCSKEKLRDLEAKLQRYAIAEQW